MQQVKCVSSVNHSSKSITPRERATGTPSCSWLVRTPGDTVDLDLASDVGGRAEPLTRGGRRCQNRAEPYDRTVTVGVRELLVGKAPHALGPVTRTLAALDTRGSHGVSVPRSPRATRGAERGPSSCRQAQATAVTVGVRPLPPLRRVLRAVSPESPRL